MAKDTATETQHDPQSGGSFIRNKDGSLVENVKDSQKTLAAEVPAAEKTGE